MTQHHDDTGRQARRAEVGMEAAEHIPGPNPVVGVRGKDIHQTLGMLARQALRQPHQVLAHGFTFAAEASRVLGGASELTPDRKDHRFQDSTWKENEFYRRGLQLYLAATHELHDWVEATISDGDDRKRAHFVLSLLTDALTLLVSVLDTGNDQTTLGVFATEEAIESARRNSQERGALPPGNPKAAFFTNAEQLTFAKAWYEGATRHTGSWWEHWNGWILAHAGSQKGAPRSPGNSTYRPQVAAPGTYVYE